MLLAIWDSPSLHLISSASISIAIGVSHGLPVYSLRKKVHVRTNSWICTFETGQDFLSINFYLIIIYFFSTVHVLGYILKNRTMNIYIKIAPVSWPREWPCWLCLGNNTVHPNVLRSKLMECIHHHIVTRSRKLPNLNLRSMCQEDFADRVTWRTENKRMLAASPRIRRRTLHTLHKNLQTGKRGGGGEEKVWIV